MPRDDDAIMGICKDCDGAIRESHAWVPCDGCGEACHWEGNCMRERGGKFYCNECIATFEDHDDDPNDNWDYPTD